MEKFTDAFLQIDLVSFGKNKKNPNANLKRNEKFLNLSQKQSNPLMFY